MAYLPISIHDVVTPYNVGPEEAAELVMTSSNKASISRRGGFVYSLTMGITPFNLLTKSSNETYWNIVGSLSLNPYIYVPVFNIAPTESFVDGKSTLSISGAAKVGSDTLLVSGATLRPGQFVRITSKTKIYQVASHDGSTLILSKPLSQNVTAGDTLTISETYSDGDLAGQPFDGVHGYFVNEDFGMTVNRIEDGILGKIGPLKFKEKL